MIRVGIGGWTFEPWRGVFFPPKLPHVQELAFAAKALTTIEVNGTFYRTQTRKTFESWAAQVPDDFVFALKAPRYAVNRKVLADAGPSIAMFVDSGIDALGDKLGPILWQFAATKVFDPDDFAAFVALLPKAVGGRALRHALEPRHASFAVPEAVAIARAAGAAIVFADSDDYPCIDADTADFRYARLQCSAEDIPTGYDDAALDRWAVTAKDWASGDREAFVYFISGAKVRNPAAAQALIARL